MGGGRMRRCKGWEGMVRRKWGWAGRNCRGVLWRLDKIWGLVEGRVVGWWEEVCEGLGVLLMMLIIHFITLSCIRTL